MKPPVVLALRAAALLTVLAGGGTALAVQVSNYEGEAEVSVPGLAALDAPERAAGHRLDRHGAK